MDSPEGVTQSVSKILSDQDQMFSLLCQATVGEKRRDRQFQELVLGSPAAVVAQPLASKLVVGHGETCLPTLLWHALFGLCLQIEVGLCGKARTRRRCKRAI